MEIRLGSSVKINDMPNGFSSANADIECVDDGLPEVLFHGCASQAAQIYSMEALLIPGNKLEISHTISWS